MGRIAIEFENISKQYALGSIGTGTLSRDLNRWWARIRGKEDPYLRIGEENDRSKKAVGDFVWALKDINFSVEEGEVLGIIGKNGAGKSTLLKILSRVTSPTTGCIRAKGRIASLLEVGTGFHPEMTGRENIYMNGSIMGMTRAEITRKLDEIVDFAGVEKYIDTPVKRYSSGMTVRLGFAIAAHLEPEILVVDEVLAVGDAEFQKKAIGKMQDVAKGEGRTVLFVSHNMAAVRSLCSRGIILENGRVAYTGEIGIVISEYLKNDMKEMNDLIIDNITELKSNIHINEIKINDSVNSYSTIVSDQKFLDVIIRGIADEGFDYDTMLTFKSKDGMPLMTYAYGHYKGIINHISKGEFEIHKRIAFPQVMSKGILKIDLYLHYPMVEVLMKAPECCTLVCEGYQDGYGRALNQNIEGVVGLLNFND